MKYNSDSPLPPEKKQIQEHFDYVSEVANMLPKTPEYISKMENEISSSESKIRAANAASSTAIGYGAEEKTGM